MHMACTPKFWRPLGTPFPRNNAERQRETGSHRGWNALHSSLLGHQTLARAPMRRFTLAARSKLPAFPRSPTKAKGTLEKAERCHHRQTGLP